jgi:hypothetical protein
MMNVVSVISLQRNIMKAYVPAMVVLLLMGAAEIQAMAKPSQKFSTLDEAAKAIWASWGRTDACSTYVEGPIPGNPANFYRVSFFTPDYKFRHGLAGIIVVDGDQFRVVAGGEEPSQKFSSVDQAAKAIWTAQGMKGDYATYVLGPIPGGRYEIYFLTPDYKSQYGSATIYVVGKHFSVPSIGCCFFYRSGRAEGTIDLSLYDKVKVSEYLADRHPEIGPVQGIRLHQGVNGYPWLWEVSCNAETYYLYVGGTPKLLTKADLDKARAPETIKVDIMIPAQYSSIDEAARDIWRTETRAIWRNQIGGGDCTTYVLGPISGKTSFYVVYFLTPDHKSFYGTATIDVEGKHFSVSVGCCFFYPSGKAEGIFNLSLYDEAKVGKYLADRHPEIGPVQSIRLLQPGISRFPWLWEVSSNAQTYYLHVSDDNGAARLMTKADLDQARAADTVKVDSVITNGGK